MNADLMQRVKGVVGDPMRPMPAARTVAATFKVTVEDNEVNVELTAASNVTSDTGWLLARGVAPGRRVTVFNRGTNTVTLTNTASASAVAGSTRLNGNSNVTLGPGNGEYAGVTLMQMSDGSWVQA